MQRRWLFSASSRRLTGYHTRRHLTDQKTFEQGDHVILRTINNKKLLLKGPLGPGKRVETSAGYIKHEHIIGRQDRDVIISGNRDGKELGKWRLHEVSLDEYVVNTRRLVTPIYPQDANLIVSLFDFHPQLRRESRQERVDVKSTARNSFFGRAINAVTSLFSSREQPAQLQQYQEEKKEQVKPSIEILEAGTGHGTLTLHLSRAIHAGNALPPDQQSSQDEEEFQKVYENWKQSRNAVIHTIDISAPFSKHAQGIVAGFRQGQYKHNVNFNVGHVQDWTSKELAQRGGEPFLTHAFLDLPSTEEQLAVVSKALRTSGTLIVFNPSISQVMESLRVVKEQRLPLILDTVRELGTNGGSGGREWDVRAVIPKAFAKKADSKLETPSDQNEDNTAAAVDQQTILEEANEDESVSDSDQDTAADASKWKMICRPKVGDRIAGGGFIAVFKKKNLNE